jgi:phospholipid/cholesterol/gamma-HCH transport system substrate-binding protein
MSTVFSVRSLKMPALSRTSVIVGIVVVVLALVAGIAGWQFYKKLTTNTATAYFTDALALYPGDQVQIMGIQVGKVESVEPQGDKTKVTFEYQSKYKVPANVSASIVNPSLVSTRNIELSPPYTTGQTLADGAVIPLERTQVPVEFDQLRDQLTEFVKQLGPTPENPAGPIGGFINSFADGLEGKGKELNTSLNSLSDALTTLSDGSGDLFAVVKSLALFVNALYKSDGQIVSLNGDLAHVTNDLTNSDHDVANLLDQANELFTTVRKFTSESGAVTTKDVDNLAEVTNAILQPAPRKGLEAGLHVLPNFGANFLNIYKPTSGSLAAIPAISNFANPLQFICSSIQAGSRLGYQDSAELCAQYLAPILDAIKFNFLPFGLNLASGADTLPKYVTYSEERLRPPPGYKDTTVPGIFSRDTLFSHGNHEPGWIVAPGMQGTEVQPLTQSMLTPDSLAALMGGPDIVVPDAPPAFGPQPGGAPDQSYPEFSPPPPYPASGPPTPPAVGNPRGGFPVAIPPPAPQVPNPPGPSPLDAGPLPAEAPLSGGAGQ